MTYGSPYAAVHKRRAIGAGGRRYSPARFPAVPVLFSGGAGISRPGQAPKIALGAFPGGGPGPPGSSGPLDPVIRIYLDSVTGVFWNRIKVTADALTRQQ
jgi:hypothetical protein